MKSKFNLHFKAIGTSWSIDIFNDIDQQQLNLLSKKIKARIEDFDRNYSRFRSDSLVTSISKMAGTYLLPADAKQLFDLYKEIYKISEGYVTPLVGGLMVDAGYDANYSLRAVEQEQVRKVEAWEDVLEYRYPNLVVKKPVLLDFGAAGKGYLIDIVGALLQNNGIDSFCIDAGGDILYRNQADDVLRVGLEHPEDFSKAIGVVGLLNKSLCGSAGNRRKWGEFHHIMDPFKRGSTKDILATWVVAESTILADIIATCLFFMDAKKLTQYYNFEYLILEPNYSFKKSLNFPAELFIQ